jgi:hypothetical protein
VAGWGSLSDGGGIGASSSYLPMSYFLPFILSIRSRRCQSSYIIHPRIPCVPPPPISVLDLFRCVFFLAGYSSDKVGYAKLTIRSILLASSAPLVPSPPPSNSAIQLSNWSIDRMSELEQHKGRFVTARLRSVARAY